jgi:choline kinase
MVPIFITTSGIGSRLGDLTQHTNKSLVPLGDMYSICHIVNKYPVSSQFVVSIGYFGQHVQDFLELAYPTHNFTFVKVDNYEGPGSSQAYSMLQAKEVLQSPFIFHCCDSITKDVIEPQHENTLYVVKKADCHQYTGISVDGPRVMKLNKKGYLHDYIYTGISFIRDYKAFWSHLERIYKEAPLNGSLGDTDSMIAMMSDGIQFRYKVLHDFCDTGNIDSYTEARQQYPSSVSLLEKSNESLCFINNTVIKFQADPRVNKQRELRGVELRPCTPIIVGTKSNFIQMEYVKGVLLSESKTYGQVKQLLEWAEVALWTDKKKNPTHIDICKQFYYDKTMQRVAGLDRTDECTKINGLTVGTLDSLLERLDFTALYTDEFSRYHGDFILDNIMMSDKNEFVLLDWRHEFGSSLHYGDMYYDLAKLRHNIFLNHKNITNNLYEITKAGDSAFVDIKCNFVLVNQLSEYDSFIREKGYDSRKIQILTAIIWLNMAPLYDGKLRQFLFYFGKLNLHLAIQTRP